MSFEQRQHARRVLVVPAIVQLAESAPLQVRTRDISAGGLAIVAPNNVKTGSVLRIGLRLPGQNGALVEAQAKVMHAVYSADHGGGFRLGLSFTEVVAGAEAIKTYVNELSSVW